MEKTCCSTVVQSTAHVKRQSKILIFNWTYILLVEFKKAQILAFDGPEYQPNSEHERISSV